MNIEIKKIPDSKQRYPTVGDYWFDPNGDIHIRISDMQNKDYEFLVAVHELVEAYLTQKRGITEDSISAFDIKFEEERQAGLHGIDEEPGYAHNAPYKNEHFIAEAIERIVANQLGVDWGAYNKTIMEL